MLVSRADLVARLAEELSAVSTVDQVAPVVTTTGRDALGAVFAHLPVIDLDHRHLDIVHSPVLPGELAERYNRIGLSEDEDVPLAHAVTRGGAVLLPDFGAVTTRYPHLVDDTTAAGLEATASNSVVPHRSLGGRGMGVGWTGPTVFTPSSGQY